MVVLGDTECDAEYKLCPQKLNVMERWSETD